MLEISVYLSHLLVWIRRFGGHWWWKAHWHLLSYWNNAFNFTWKSWSNSTYSNAVSVFCWPHICQDASYTIFRELQSTLDRRRLHYADSLGKGWFGWVIRGRYQGTEVIVQSLREEASAKDQKRFIEMALSAYRARDHPNVLRLIGTSMDHPPYLIALEFCEAGNLKTFLANAQGTFKISFVCKFQDCIM